MSCRTQRAFTLVEAIASIAVIGLLGGMAGVLLHRSVEGYQGTAEASRLHQELASAMDRIDRALREIDAAGDGSTPDIKAVSPTSLDWDSPDGSSSLAESDGRLTLAINSADPLLILTGVTSFHIQCFDESNSALPAHISGASVENIRRVQVTITASRNGITDTLRTRIFLRCTMAGSIE